MVTFLRRTSNRYSKLGKGRKKKQVWRKPTGRHNKMRLKEKSYPAVVSIGYRTDKKVRNTLEEKLPVMIKTLKDLEKMKENQIAIIGNIGKKKKIVLVKVAKEKKIKIHNLNVVKFLKEVEKKKKKVEKPKEEKTTKEKKK
jgi:large subunit ribosomal protein L32e